MEHHARAPEPLSNKQPMDKTWKMWKQQFIIFLKAAGIDRKSNEDKAVYLMNIIGNVGLEAMENMEFENDEDRLDFDILIKKFDDHFDPPKRETEERFKFYSRSKKNNETIEAYISDLKEKAKACNFGDLTDSLVRDMVILDIKDKHLRKIMFEEKDLDLSKLTLIYRQFELSTEKMKEVTRKTASENVDTRAQQPQKPKETKAPSDNKPTNFSCWRCGTTHQRGKCPAFTVTCEKCKEKGHFTQKCNKNNITNNTNQNANKNKNYTKNPFSQIDKSKCKN